MTQQIDPEVLNQLQQLQGLVATSFRNALIVYYNGYFTLGRRQWLRFRVRKLHRIRTGNED